MGAWLFGLGNAAGLFTGRLAAQTPKSPAAAGRNLGKEFSYDLGNLGRTDPKYLLYKEVKPFPTGLKELRAVAIAPNDEVMVAGDKSLVGLNKNGNRSRVISLKEAPRCLAIGVQGRCYVGLKDHVEVYGPDSQSLARWDGVGAKAVLTSIAIADKDVFLADAGNRLVLRYDVGGKLKGQIGKKDLARNITGFIIPSPYFDIAVGAGDILWAANPGQHRLEAYTFDGDLEKTWGQVSNSLPGFCGCCNPAHFALLPDGRFVTSEKGLTRIKVYSNRGEFEGAVAGPESFPKIVNNPNANSLGLDVAIDSQGRIFIADSSTGEIRIFERLTRA